MVARSPPQNIRKQDGAWVIDVKENAVTQERCRNTSTAGLIRTSLRTSALNVYYLRRTFATRLKYADVQEFAISELSRVLCIRCRGERMVRSWTLTGLSELEFANEGCSVGALTFRFLTADLGQDIDAMDSQEAREAFLEKTAKMDRENYAAVLKPTWLLSYSSALDRVRKSGELFEASFPPSGATAEVKKRAADASWSAGVDDFMSVCMFRAGKLAGQGKLIRKSDR